MDARCFDVCDHFCEHVAEGLVAIDGRIREAPLQIIYQDLPLVAERDTANSFRCRCNQYPPERAAGNREGDMLACAGFSKYFRAHAERRACIRVEAAARIEAAAYAASVIVRVRTSSLRRSSGAMRSRVSLGCEARNLSEHAVKW
jgi:hypothetical protein